MSPLFGPSADKILTSGQPVPGVVTGIEVKTTHDDSPIRYTEWAIEAGGTTYGIRQQPADESTVRLGMPVTLRVDGKSAVIDWGDGSAGRWKMLGTPPAAGIVDDHDESDNRGALSRARKGGKPATITILGFEKRSVAMGLSTVMDAKVRVDPAEGEPYETTVKNLATPPGYASHLPSVGARLPAWETSGFFGGDGIRVDWPAAATATPGIGEPSVAAPAAGLFSGTGLLSTMVSDTEAVQSTEPLAEGEMPEIPEYAKKFMQKFGVDTTQFEKGGPQGDAKGDDAEDEK